jgi:hypothetical protein
VGQLALGLLGVEGEHAGGVAHTVVAEVFHQVVEAEGSGLGP